MTNVMRTVFFTVIFMTLASCNAPLFRSEDNRLAAAPEVIEQVEPYLEDWATLDPETTKQQQEEMLSRTEGIISIGYRSLMTEDGQTIVAVVIVLETFYDWERGYLYIHEDNIVLRKSSDTEWRQLDDHFYIYNRNY
jgi:hypothetical protein